MLASDLIEVLCAAHLSYYVDSPFPERGGIMVVGPPGALKSTFLGVLDKQYHDAVTMSDINARGLVDLRDQISTGSIRTLVLPELAKVYERAEATAKNVEGTLRAMTAEGFQAASFEDQRISRLTAQAMVIAGMTPATREKNNRNWEDTGFNRRFLWSLVRLSDPEVLVRAVLKWEKINFQFHHIPRPPLTGTIPYHIHRQESEIIRGWVKYQPGGSSALHVQLMTKILCVLQWWYKQVSPERSAMGTLGRFAESLGRQGGEIDIQEMHPTKAQVAVARRKARKAQVSEAARELSARAQRKRKGGAKK